MKNYFTGTNEEFPFFFFYSFFSQKKGHRCAYEERYRGDREGRSHNGLKSAKISYSNDDKYLMAQHLVVTIVV